MPAWLGLRTAGACLVALGLLGIGVSLGTVAPVDEAVEGRLAEIPPDVRAKLLWASEPGHLVSSAAATVGGIMACLALGSRRNAVLMLLAVPLDLSVRLLKLAFEVPRPNGFEGFGFPSGHSARAVGVLGLTLLLVYSSWRSQKEGRPRIPGWAIAVWLVTGAIEGGARALGGVHWASDVLGGLLVGLAFAAAANHWAQRTPAERGKARAEPAPPEPAAQ